MYNFFIPKNKTIFLAFKEKEYSKSDVDRYNNLNLLNENIFYNIEFVNYDYFKKIGNEFIFKKNLIVNIQLYLTFRTKDVTNNLLQFGLNFFNTNNHYYILTNKHPENVGYITLNLSNPNTNYTAARYFTIPVVENNIFIASLMTRDTLTAATNFSGSLVIHTNY